MKTIYFCRLVSFLLLFPLMLTACTTMGGAPGSYLSEPSARSGQRPQPPPPLSRLEELYKSNPDDPNAALQFAQGLRTDGNLKKASLILDPFVRQKDARANILSEFASIQLDNTQYVTAENFARKAVAKDSSAYRAYQILGMSLEAQEKFEEAEKAFREAFEKWKGDPIPIMNNLAFNLTNQERLGEALEIMEKAKEKAPNRSDVERNLRIIRTLNESASGRPAPKPVGKPTDR